MSQANGDNELSSCGMKMSNSYSKHSTITLFLSAMPGFFMLLRSRFVQMSFFNNDFLVYFRLKAVSQPRRLYDFTRAKFTFN
jgi:hypothetical protein